MSRGLVLFSEGQRCADGAPESDTMSWRCLESNNGPDLQDGGGKRLYAIAGSGDRRQTLAVVGASAVGDIGSC